ncbi:sulfite exporter TauE/SafE family protein [Oscillibacter hominis]|uniref:Probable membrane transporter protein n=1 Tax=Oscillibacter hominis TaxID=2763056 RepID=A0A7G9B8N7_9FIRM|nr:sulfite exporter TauE/SafE family protein [Oscillibacter hominis]
MAAAGLWAVPALRRRALPSVKWVLPVLCGAFTGMVSSWGIGGGTLLLLLMTLFLDVPQQTAQGINLLFFLPTAAAALYSHWKNDFLDKPTIRAAAPWGVAAALACAWIATAVEVELLRKPFGLFLLYVGANMLWKSFQKDKKDGT